MMHCKRVYFYFLFFNLFFVFTEKAHCASEKGMEVA